MAGRIPRNDVDTDVVLTYVAAMNNHSKAAVKRRTDRMKASGRYNFDNMTKAEKEVHIQIYGPPPERDVGSNNKKRKMWACGDLTNKGKKAS